MVQCGWAWCGGENERMAGPRSCRALTVRLRHLQAPLFPEWQSPQLSASRSNIVCSVMFNTPWLLLCPIQSFLLLPWVSSAPHKSLIIAFVPLDCQHLFAHLLWPIKVPRETFNVCRLKEWKKGSEDNLKKVKKGDTCSGWGTSQAEETVRAQVLNQEHAWWIWGCLPLQDSYVCSLSQLHGWVFILSIKPTPN